MTVIVLALLIGIVAGLRAMTAPAAAAFAAPLRGVRGGRNSPGFHGIRLDRLDPRCRPPCPS